MNSILNVTTKIIAFSDGKVSSNPRLKNVDWYRDMSGQPVIDPRTETLSLLPGASRVLFDGSFTTAIDNTSTFSLAMSTIEASRYRLSLTGGTNPNWRTPRNLTLNGVAVTFTVNNNMTVNVSVPVGPDFAAVQVGDEIFVPHTTTGDATSPVSVLNAGYWTVLSKASSTAITLVRSGISTFEAVTQTVTLTNSNQFRAYSAAGVQVGYSMDIAAGFAPATRKTFKVLRVADTFVEFVSSAPLASETGIQPGTAGLLFYSTSKNFIYVEADSECVVQVNTDTSNASKLVPPDAANQSWPAQYLRRGPTWKLTVVNSGASEVAVFIVHAE